MNRLSAGGILSALVVFGVAPAIAAQPPVVQRSGNVFHVAACKDMAVGASARCMARIVSDKNGKIIVSAKAPVAGFGPSDLRDAYNIKPMGKSSTIVAIVDAFGYDNAESDLGVYRSNFGLPACTTDNGCFKKLNQKGLAGPYPAQNLGWAQESALDLDMASAMCPGCTIYLVEGRTNSFKNLGAAVKTAARLGAHVISNSYSGTEGKYALNFEKYYTRKNIAITASTGDGAYRSGVGAPADMPGVIAVGGTHLVRDGSDRGWTETVWGGAGSGCSAIFKKPVWQKDSGCSNRMVGDVSAVADPATGVAVYGPTGSGSGWLVFGGTSVSAPLIGGIFGANGGTVHYASSIYRHFNQLFDVTSGSNGTCDPAYFCTGEVGYDGPTGLGTPNGIGAFGD